MKLGWLKSVVVCLIMSVALPVWAGSNITFGGEIPWPLAHQHEITAENSRGVWEIKQETGTRLYNVEILHEVEGTTFVRVSEMDPETFEVISWGEGFFKKEPTAIIGTDYWGDYLNGGNPGLQDVGRYLYMYPNGDLTESPYMLRLVEVTTQLGISLGISIYPLTGNNSFEHMLGSRLEDQPLACHVDHVNDLDQGQDNLVCDWPLDEDNDQE